MSNINRSMTTAALLALAAGMYYEPIITPSNIRQRRVETDEERQARELAGIEQLRRRKVMDAERMRLATEKRERRAAKRLSNR